jgi:hypothetical protein
MALFSKKKTDEEIASEESEELLIQLKKYWDEGTTAMKNRRDKWKKHYNYWINRQLSSSRPQYKSDIRVNYCWVVTQVKIPFLTQNRPRVNFIPFDMNPEAEARAEHQSKLIGNALWHKLKIQRKNVDVLWNAMVYDIGYWKCGWDPDADDGRGEIFAESNEPFKIIPDPTVTDIQKGRFVIHVEYYPVSALKKRYPKQAEEISSSRDISEILFEERRFSDRRPTTATETFDDRSGIVNSDTKFAIERAYLQEYWLAPSECDQKKYPRGRVITTINNKVIVKDRPHPYDHGKFPFIRQIMNVVGNEFYGMGDIEMVIPLQDALNHAYQQIDDIITYTANIGWKVNPALGESNIKKLAASIGKPGALKVVPPDQLEADIAPQIPPNLLIRPGDIIQRIFDVTGVSEILQGSGRVSHRTARGIERLYEAGSSRIGQSIQFMEQTLGELSLQMAALAQQFYGTERIHAIIGGNGMIAGSLKTGPGDLSGQYEVSIDSGAALPRDKQSRADLVFELLKNHIFEMALSDDPRQKKAAKLILDAVEFPGREELLAFKPLPPSVEPPQAPPGNLLAQSPIPAPIPGAGMPAGAIPATTNITGGTIPPEIQDLLNTSGLSLQDLMAMASQAGIGPA